MPSHQRNVTSRDLALGHLARERFESLGRFGDHQQARGSLVETVHDARTIGVAQTHFGETSNLGIARQQSRDQRALALTRAGVHHLAGRLVDHDEVLVVTTTSTSTLASASSAASGRRAQLRHEALATRELQRRLGHDFVVDPNATVFDRLDAPRRATDR